MSPAAPQDGELVDWGLPEPQSSSRDPNGPYAELSWPRLQPIQKSDDEEEEPSTFAGVKLAWLQDRGRWNRQSQGRQHELRSECN